MDRNERLVIEQLLRWAADAWAQGAVRAAQRLTAAAHVVADGRPYVDAADESEADR